MRHNVVAFRLWVIIGLLMCGLGCSSQTRPQAAAISDAGAQVAEAAAKTHQDLIEATVRSVEGQYLLAGLSNRPPPSDIQVGAINDLTSSLSARAVALQDLARVYRSLGQLAAYDAAGEVEGRLNDLTDSVNTFGAAVKKDKFTPISNVDKGIIGRVGGAIAVEVQGAQIRAASRPIRERVVVLRDLLKEQQKKYQSLVQDNANEQRLLAIELYKHGLGQDDLSLRSLLNSYGFDPTDEQVKALLEKGSTKLSGQLVTLYGFRREQAAKQQGVILASAIAAMDALIEQHVQLEASANISIDQLNAQVLQINKLLADYKQWKDADEAAKKKPKTKE